MLQYLVSQGDLHPPPRQTSPTEIAGQKLPVRLFSVSIFTQVIWVAVLLFVNFSWSVNLKSAQMFVSWFELSESPAAVLPCPPAETAEINQYDLTDALMDTERSHRDESTDPGTSESDCSIFVEYMAAVAPEGEWSEVCSMPSCCSQHVEVSLSQNNPKLHHCSHICVMNIFFCWHGDATLCECVWMKDLKRL